MDKRIKKSLKASIAALASIIALNQAMGAAVLSATPALMNSRISTDERAILEQIVTPESFMPIDYLNLSSMLVNNYSEGEGVCRDYALETYEVYLKLVELSGKPEYKDDIRFSTGFSGTAGHVWVEVKEKNKFVPYETTLYTPIMKTSEISAYSKETLEEKTAINGGYDSPWLKVTNSVPGTLSSYPTLRALVYPGGFYRILYEGIAQMSSK
jgi:hypothetical protein